MLLSNNINPSAKGFLFHRREAFNASLILTNIRRQYSHTGYIIYLRGFIH